MNITLEAALEMIWEKQNEMMSYEFVQFLFRVNDYTKTRNISGDGKKVINVAIVLF
ncbi:unknown protein [Paenibacillus amylolyticus]|uniref:Uncharacterized protein n=1 Tax=Paenibacillus amylolyticus TaxID=1451 RepID=A0A100VQQ2_PAEAM|nr:unknown protein [Paenibacillus amylolyticus]